MLGKPPAYFTSELLGSVDFKADYGLRYAYLAGAMYRGIASTDLVVRLGQVGMMGFFGAGGCSLGEVELAIRDVQARLSRGEAYGFNLIANYRSPEKEMEVVVLYLRLGVKRIEASAFMQVTPALVWFRVSGLRRAPEGGVTCDHQVVAKLSRPEVAEAFMKPAPDTMVTDLQRAGRITAEQAQLAAMVPMSHDICVEADSGGHTDRGNSTVLFPGIQSLRARLQLRLRDPKRIRVGLAGGIGTPAAAAAAFVMGADFILTGSINQCTVEAGMSEAVKDLLQEINVQDTAYAPAGDMFETGAKVQVLRRGVLFPARANKLFSLYQQYNGLDAIPEAMRRQIEEKYFGCFFSEVWQEIKVYLQSRGLAEEIDKSERSEKHRMAQVFRWYFRRSFRLAKEGDPKNQVDFQVHTGPALGAFNQWVAGSVLASWRQRHVDQIAIRLLEETAVLFNRHYTLVKGVGGL